MKFQKLLLFTTTLIFCLTPALCLNAVGRRKLNDFLRKNPVPQEIFSSQSFSSNLDKSLIEDIKDLLSGLDETARKRNSSLSQEVLGHFVNQSDFLKKLPETGSLSGSKLQFSIKCSGCKYLFGKISGLLNNNRSIDDLLVIGRLACSLFLNSTVCEGVMKDYGVSFLYNFFVRNLNPSYICSMLSMCPADRNYLNFTDYLNEILKDKPKLEPVKPTGRKTYKLLHLADPHTDYEYEEGKNAFCNEPFCCRAENGLPDDPSKASMYWGTLSICDIPERTLEQAFKFMAEELKPDMIIWTGDNIAHDIWHQNETYQPVPTEIATKFIKKYLPGVPLFPVFGNHEVFPADQFDFFGNSTSWLLKKTGEIWSEYLDDAALKSYEQYGFYSMYHKDQNLRVITLNTQACDSLNFYLMQNPTDPWNELQWLRSVLSSAEQNNETVFIMGHVPPGYLFCHSNWAKRFKVLVDRYSHIIRGQFYGHTHQDHFEVMTSFIDEKPMSTAFITPSLTTFSAQNPSIRIFEVDADTNIPVNILQYRLNLTKANMDRNSTLKWDLAYDFLSEYNLTDMSWESMYKLAEDFAVDEEKLRKFAYNFYAGGPDGQLSPEQLKNSYNKKIYSCGAKTSVFIDRMKCTGIDIIHEPTDFVFLFLQSLTGEWYTPAPQ